MITSQEAAACVCLVPVDGAGLGRSLLGARVALVESVMQRVLRDDHLATLACLQRSAGPLFTASGNIIT